MASPGSWLLHVLSRQVSGSGGSVRHVAEGPDKALIRASKNLIPYIVDKKRKLAKRKIPYLRGDVFSSREPAIGAEEAQVLRRSLPGVDVRENQRRNLSRGGRIIDLHPMATWPIALHEVAHLPGQQGAQTPPKTAQQEILRRALKETISMVPETIAAGVAPRMSRHYWPYRYMTKHGPKLTGNKHKDVGITYDWAREAHDPSTNLGRMVQQWANALSQPGFDAQQMYRRTRRALRGESGRPENTPENSMATPAAAAYLRHSLRNAMRDVPHKSKAEPEPFMTEGRPKFITEKMLRGFLKGKALPALTQNIAFPEDEHVALQKRLRAGKSIFTLRVDKEQGKYKKGQAWRSSVWKTPLRVKSVKTIQDPKEYQFYGEMKPEWIEAVRGQTIDVVELEEAPPEHLLITGPPGSGKTVRATKLGRKLNRPVVYLDRWTEQEDGKFVSSGVTPDKVAALKKPSVVEGSQLMNFPKEFLNEHILALLEKDEGTLVRRLARRGYHDEEGTRIQNAKKAREMLAEYMSADGILEQFKKRMAKEKPEA